MTLPYLFQEGFEGSTLGNFDSTQNGNSKVFVRHYSWLAKNLNYPDAVPYKGSYAGHLDLSLGTADAYWQEATGAAVSANNAAACRFYFWASNNLTMAASDTFDLLLWQSVGPVNELSVNLLNNAGTIQIRAGDTGGGTFRSSDLTLNTWHCVELVINTGTGVNATCSFYLDGYLIGAQITGITSAALTQARLGAINIDAGTTAGHLLFDEVVFDDTQVGRLTNRFGQTRILTQSGHAVLGQASLMEADLILSSSNDETCSFWDTDEASTLDISKRVIVYGQMNPIHITQGLYCLLAGTNPILAVKVHSAEDMSSGAIKNLGRAR